MLNHSLQTFCKPTYVSLIFFRKMKYHEETHNWREQSSGNLSELWIFKASHEATETLLQELSAQSQSARSQLRRQLHPILTEVNGKKSLYDFLTEMYRSLSNYFNEHRISPITSSKSYSPRVIYELSLGCNVFA